MKPEDTVVKGASLPGGPRPSSAPAPGLVTVTATTVRKMWSLMDKSMMEIAIDIATRMDLIGPGSVGFWMIVVGLMYRSDSPLGGRMSNILFVMGGIMCSWTILEMLADSWWHCYTGTPMSDDVGSPTEYNGRARVFTGLLVFIAEGWLLRDNLRSALNEASFTRDSENYLNPASQSFVYLFAAYVDLLRVTGMVFPCWYVIIRLCACCRGLIVLAVSCYKATFGKKKASVDCDA